MAAEAGLQVQYLPLAAQASARWDGVLGFATFDPAPGNGSHASLAPREIPVAAVHTPVLGGAVCEIWHTRQQLESGQCSHVRYRRGDEILFGCISLPETDGLQATTGAAYKEIFAAVDELGYPHLLRVWNYLPQINVHAQGTERYWQFNSARRKAIAESGRDTGGSVPAACALGSANGSPLVIYFLASRKAPTLIENPRQISAVSCYHNRLF